jgi:hypothetical protein
VQANPRTGKIVRGRHDAGKSTQQDEADRGSEPAARRVPQRTNPGLRKLEEQIGQPETEARAEHGDQNPKSRGGELRSG